MNAHMCLALMVNGESGRHGKHVPELVMEVSHGDRGLLQSLHHLAGVSQMDCLSRPELVIRGLHVWQTKIAYWMTGTLGLHALPLASVLRAGRELSKSTGEARVHLAWEV